MSGSRGGGGVPDPPLKNHKNIGFLSNYGPDPLKNYAATEPAFNFGASSERDDAIQTAFRWLADDGPLIVVLDPPTPHQLKKKPSKLDPL